MGFTKRELVRFFDGLTGLISEEKQSEAKILIRGFILDFEKSYKYEDAVLQKDVPYVPPYYISVMPQSLQEEIREKLTAKLTEWGEYSPEKIEQMMRVKIYDLKELIDIKDYAKWADDEIYRDFARKLEASR
ncbi:MAG: hypothetical protein LUC95_11695 [Lachnospiraceae bacterium]|nr:hypothetical protein [Lachnospiraceae bacterium]